MQETGCLGRSDFGLVLHVLEDGFAIHRADQSQPAEITSVQWRLFPNL